MQNTIDNQTLDLIKESINADVFDIYKYVSEKFKQNKYSHPILFFHSPTSIVFCWEAVTRSGYITISSRTISFLVSSLESILYRSSHEIPAIISNIEDKMLWYWEHIIQCFVYLEEYGINTHEYNCS